MTVFKRFLTGALLTGAVAGIASASSIDSVSAVVTFNTDGSYSLTLNKFNVGGGAILTGATLYFKGSEDVSLINFSNTASTTQTFDALATSNLVFGSTNTANNADKYNGESLDLFDTGIGPNQATLPVTSGPITLGPTGAPACAEAAPNATCSTVSYTPPDEIVNNTDAVYGLASGTGVGGVDGVIKSITGADLANYTGAGTFNLAGATKGLTTFSGGGNNIGFNINTVATFQAEIDYTYTTPSGTPEPATMILFGSGLVGLGLLRKRIKS